MQTIEYPMSTGGRLKMSLLMADLVSEACKYLLHYGHTPETRRYATTAVLIKSASINKTAIDIRGRFKKFPLVILQHTDVVYPNCEPIETYNVVKAKKVCFDEEEDDPVLWRDVAIEAIRTHLNYFCTSMITREVDLRKFYEQNQHRLVGKSVRVRGWGVVKVVSVTFVLDCPAPMIGFISPEKGDITVSFNDITHIQELDY